jgi:hypothetical protein
MRDLVNQAAARLRAAPGTRVQVLEDLARDLLAAGYSRDVVLKLADAIDCGLDPDLAAAQFEAHFAMTALKDELERARRAR